MLSKAVCVTLLLFSTLSLAAQPVAGKNVSDNTSQAIELNSANSQTQSCIFSDSIEAQAEQLAAKIVYTTAKPWLQKHGFDLSVDPAIDSHMACHSMGDADYADDGDGDTLFDGYCDTFVVSLNFSDGTHLALNVYGNAAPTGGNGVLVEKNVTDSQGNLTGCAIVFPKIVLGKNSRELPDAGSYIYDIYNIDTKYEFFAARGLFSENIPIPATTILSFSPSDIPSN